MIVCAGIIVRDTFCGPLDRLPAPGELTVVNRMPTSAGGCAANVALNLVRQNLPVDLVGCLGRDASADVLIKLLQAKGIDCSRVTFTPDFPTSETVILIVGNEDRRYIHSFGANQAFTTGDIDRAWLSGKKLFYLGGLCALPAIDFSDLIDLLKFCRGNGIVSVLDVVVPVGFARIDELRRILPYVDWFLPNGTEATSFTGEKEPSKAAAILQEWGAKNVIITLGAEGAFAVSGGQFWRSKTYSWKALDPSGAGDAFASGIITGIVHAWDMPEMLQHASTLGASATRAVGTTDGVFSFEEARQLAASNPVEVTTGRFPMIG